MHHFVIFARYCSAMLADTDEPVGLVTEMSGFAIITRAANRHGQYSKDRYDNKVTS